MKVRYSLNERPFMAPVLGAVDSVEAVMPVLELPHRAREETK
jgi:hypothetical protein